MGHDPTPFLERNLYSVSATLGEECELQLSHMGIHKTHSKVRSISENMAYWIQGKEAEWLHGPD